jgi:hypothetical protein
MHDARASALDRREAVGVIGTPYSPRGHRVAGGLLPSLLGAVAAGHWSRALIAGGALYACVPLHALSPGPPVHSPVVACGCVPLWCIVAVVAWCRCCGASLHVCTGAVSHYCTTCITQYEQRHGALCSLCCVACGGGPGAAVVAVPGWCRWLCVTFLARRLHVTRHCGTASWVRRNFEVLGWYLNGFGGGGYTLKKCVPAVISNSREPLGS